MPETDAYDKAVEYLTEHPEWIESSWGSPTTTRAGILFRFAGPATDRFRPYDYRGEECGCITEVKCGYRRAATPGLTLAIRDDDRIPCEFGDIQPADLPVFAEWQRRIDAELGRTPLTWGDKGAVASAS